MLYAVCIFGEAMVVLYISVKEKSICSCILRVRHANLYVLSTLNQQNSHGFALGIHRFYLWVLNAFLFFVVVFQNGYLIVTFFAEMQDHHLTNENAHVKIPVTGADGQEASRARR